MTIGLTWASTDAIDSNLGKAESLFTLSSLYLMLLYYLFSILLLSFALYLLVTLSFMSLFQ